jgi:hypothetical protein
MLTFGFVTGGVARQFLSHSRNSYLVPDLKCLMRSFSMPQLQMPADSKEQREGDEVIAALKDRWDKGRDTDRPCLMHCVPNLTHGKKKQRQYNPSASSMPAESVQSREKSNR